MFNNPQMSVNVSGGTPEENAQLVSVIHQSLFSCGFTNVGFAQGQDMQNMPMLAVLRKNNPELFDTKIVIGTEDFSPAQPIPAPVVNQAGGGFMDWLPGFVSPSGSFSF